MDKSWISNKNRLSAKYNKGLQNFIRLSSSHRNEENKIRCPCLLIDSPKDQNNQVQHELSIDDIDEEALLSGSDSETDCDENFIMSSSTRKGSSKRGRTDTSDQSLSSTRRFSSKRAHNDTQSPSDPAQSLTSSTDDPSTVLLHDEQHQSSKEIQKNVRGPTRGDHLSRELKNDKITNLTVTYNKGELRVYGDNASDFTINVVVNVRHHAPLQYSGWSKVPPSEKKAVYARIHDVFKIDFVKDPYLEKKSVAGSKNRSKKSTPKEMIELREDQLNQLEAGTLIMVDETAIYRQVLGDAKYGWLRELDLEKDGVFEKYIQEKVDKRVESLERKFLEEHKFQSSSNKETKQHQISSNPPQQWPTPATMDKTYRLTLRDSDVVAIGEIFLGKQVHGKDLEKGNVRVRIIECLNENARLPVHVRDDLIFVKDAVESFVAWPEHLIILGDSEALKTMEKNEHLSPHMPTQKASTSSMNVKDSPVPFVMPKIIPRSVKAILLSVQYRKSRDEYRFLTIAMLQKRKFQKQVCNNRMENYTNEDIDEIRMEWADALIELI
ncbi:hypothetical protein G4B88_003611 [Cannabis sativa]|uniref:Transposase Tnp1/En/Spm-like domain-containing protein n=1 Tax=Cannabis sativa TaxID=3483 RepID=A0A7J6FBE2_CANSA|nr:hypothetical protein G4B88_003611 [Cannabis sativa]